LISFEYNTFRLGTDDIFLLKFSSISAYNLPLISTQQSNSFK